MISDHEIANFMDVGISNLKKIKKIFPRSASNATNVPTAARAIPFHRPDDWYLFVIIIFKSFKFVSRGGVPIVIRVAQPHNFRIGSIKWSSIWTLFWFKIHNVSFFFLSSFNNVGDCLWRSAPPWCDAFPVWLRTKSSTFKSPNQFWRPFFAVSVCHHNIELGFSILVFDFAISSNRVRVKGKNEVRKIDSFIRKQIDEVENSGKKVDIPAIGDKQMKYFVGGNQVLLDTKFSAFEAVFYLFKIIFGNLFWIFQFSDSFRVVELRYRFLQISSNSVRIRFQLSRLLNAWVRINLQFLFQCFPRLDRFFFKEGDKEKLTIDVKL